MTNKVHIYQVPNIQYSNIQNNQNLELNLIKTSSPAQTNPNMTWTDLISVHLYWPDLCLTWHSITLYHKLSTTNFRQISHSKLEISLHLSNINVSKLPNRLTNVLNSIKWWSKYSNTPGISSHFRSDIFSKTETIPIFV